MPLTHTQVCLITRNLLLAGDHMAHRRVKSTFFFDLPNPQKRNDSDVAKVQPPASEVCRVIDERERLPMVLSGWKAIGNYLGKGVRTAQRYERHFGLPVRRPSGKSCGAVLAARDEIDAWMGTTHMRNGSLHDRITLEALFLEVTALKRHIEDIQPLREQTNELSSELQHAIRLVHSLLPVHQRTTLREADEEPMPLLPQVHSLYFCWICGHAVDLTICVTDEHGMAIHEDCYIAKLRLELEPTKLAENHHQFGGADSTRLQAVLLRYREVRAYQQ
jgi:hypothetical protein